MLEHWQTEHDNLQLEDIEYVSLSVAPSLSADLNVFSEDDDEDDDEKEGSVAPSEAPSEHVKEDPDAEDGSGNTRRKSRQRTPSNELHIYSEAELARFKRKDMIADAELLDGESMTAISASTMLTKLQKN